MMGNRVDAILRPVSRLPLCILAVAGLVAILADAPEARLVVEPSVGFDQNCKSGYWAPVAVRITNVEGDDFTGQVEIVLVEGVDRVTNVYSRTVVLPGPSSMKEFHLAVYFPAGSKPEVFLQLKEGRRVLKEHSRKLSMTFREPEERLFVLVDPNLTVLKSLNTRKLENDDTLSFISVQPWMLPELSTAYESVHGVCLGDIDPSDVTLPAQAALRDYVRSGGNLIVFTGASGQRFRGTWVEDLLPVNIGETRVVPSLDAFAATYGPIVLTPGIVLSQSALKSDSTFENYVFRQDAIPLIARDRLGNGEVTFVAFDPDESQFQEPINTRAINEIMLSLVGKCRLLPRVLDSGLKQQTGGFTFLNDWTQEDQKIDQQIRDHPSMRIPDFTFIGGFLVLYVIVLGPVNYFFLKKRKRLELAWITVPAIVLVFSAGAYAVGRMTKGNQEVVHAITFARGCAGIPGLFYETYFGLFSPGKTSYDLSVQNGAAPFREYRSPGALGEGMSLDFGDGAVMNDYGMNMWTMDTFCAAGFWDSEGEHGLLESDLVLEATAVVGEIRNNLDFPLRGAYLMLGDDVVLPVGDLAPGQSHTLTNARFGRSSKPVKLSDYLRYDAGEPHEKSLAMRGLDLAARRPEYARPGGLSLWAWVEPAKQPLPEISIGRSTPREGATLVQFALPIESNTGIIPYGLTRRMMVKSEGGVREVNDNVLLANGSATFEFSLPGVSDLSQVKSLKVAFNIRDTNPNSSGYTAAIYNWQIKGNMPLRGNRNDGKAWVETFNDGASSFIRPVDPVVRIIVTQGDPKKEDDGTNYYGGINYNPYYGGGGEDLTHIGNAPAICITNLDVQVEMNP